MKEQTKEKIKNVFRSVWQFLANPHLLLCFGLAWLITNGWSYIVFGIGTLFKIKWMMAVGGAYLALLWVPFTPEKIITVALAFVFLRLFFPSDEKTLGKLREIRDKIKSKK